MNSPAPPASLGADAEHSYHGHPSLRLLGDFTNGGNYVVTGHKISGVDLSELSLWLRSPDADRITLRINDGSGQTHQIDVKVDPQPDWQHVVLPLEKFFAHRGQADAVPNIARYESWGGAKDGKWHGPATALYILLGKRSETKLRSLWIGEVQLLPRLAPFKGRPMELTRTVEQPEPTAGSDPFPIRPGLWEVTGTYDAKLQSPDNSYHAAIVLQCFDAAHKALEPLPVAEVFGTHAQESLHQTVTVPKGAASARVEIAYRKTWGDFALRDLTVTPAGEAPPDSRIARALFTTAQLGNLLFPKDSRVVQVTLEARQPLTEKQPLTCEVRDYWGAEQTQPFTLPLGEGQKKGDRTVYGAGIDLAGAHLQEGRYYELHVSLPPEHGEAPFHASTSLAILPEAATRAYKPEEIPFTSRNWDNRIPDYIRLTDRLGVRICGLWGRSSAKPPYESEAPGLPLCRELGMGWLTTTACASVEAGKTEYDEAALRGGVRELIGKFGKERPLIINLGNEPHGTGERVTRNVAAYKAVYEEVKKIDSTIPVVATSVEPNEEYFRDGYGQWCDAFDFHIYEGFADVRRTMGEYRALMEKYHCVKPLWSTELGLNSQGQTRQAVARELTKKFVTFFAAGGANVSWFCLLYPDPEGKNVGTSGESHDVFDCKYSHYAPRLDALAYYNAVNAICIKKFVGEKSYPEGVSAFLFRDRDGRNLQVLWKDKGRLDVAIPLPGVQGVEVIRIDGSHRALQAAGKDLTITLTEDPLLLLYEGPAGPLPPALGPPPVSLAALPVFQRGAPAELNLQVLAKEELTLQSPPNWRVQQSGSKFLVTAPTETAAREADLTIALAGGRGELYVHGPLEGK